MNYISVTWLLLLGSAATWAVLFSLFNGSRLRAWRNLGLLAGYVLGVVMAFTQPWPVTLGTWGIFGVSSGILYAAYESWAERTLGIQRLTPVVHGLVLWPIMLPEAVEYWLADLGVLRPPSNPPGTTTGVPPVSPGAGRPAAP